MRIYLFAFAALLAVSTAHAHEDERIAALEARVAALEAALNSSPPVAAAESKEAESGKVVIPVAESKTAESTIEVVAVAESKTAENYKELVAMDERNAAESTIEVVAVAESKTAENYKELVAIDERNATERTNEAFAGYSKWESPANWRKLKTGMSYDEVRNILGEPGRVSGRGITNWIYGSGGRVTFARGGVNDWQEPDPQDLK